MCRSRPTVRPTSRSPPEGGPTAEKNNYKVALNLASKINEDKVVLLTDYRGISVADVTDLRTKLREKDVEYKVIKNNITRRALEECKIEGLEELLEGPTAIVMGNIRSQSVQINNGAVIEGMCSQVYAEVNPSAFFEELRKK